MDQSSHNNPLVPPMNIPPFTSWALYSSANLHLDDCQKEVSGSGKQDAQGRGDL